MTDYFAVANKYIDDVLSGAVPACKYVKQACERQKKDLTNKKLPYVFDLEKATRICKFSEKMPHIKGKLAGTLIKLEPWQIFILTTVFGWVKKDGNRRFRTAYLEIPRKNAKSTIASCVGLYCLSADGEGGAEIYSAATTREQAGIVHKDAKAMSSKSAWLKKYFKVEVSANSVFVKNSQSAFKALSRDQGGNHDGLNVHCAIIDEMHAHKTRDIYDVIDTATGARTQSLIWIVTTAGFNKAGICYEQRRYLGKILDGSVKDEEFFGLIYSIDEDDDWSDQSSWIKANPNYGVSVDAEDIARKARKALEEPSSTNNFLTKHLNIWVNADVAWMDMRKWAAANTELSIEEFKDCPCWIGLDLASKLDIAALVLIFKKPEDDSHKYYIFSKFYLPEDTVQNSTNSQYDGWARQGFLTVTDGAVIDYSVIEKDLLDFYQNYNVQEVCYDPFQATQLYTRMSGEGLTMVEVRPTVLNFSEPMKELEAMTIKGNLKHENNPVMDWMVSNTVCHRDAKENIYPRKENEKNKIDGVVAAIMALSRAIAGQEEDLFDVDAFLAGNTNLMR